MGIYTMFDDGKISEAFIEERREEWAKVRDLLSATMLMANAWDAMECPQDATRKRVQDALAAFGK